MRSEPSHVRALDEPRLQPEHLCVLVDACADSSWRQRRGPEPLRNFLFFTLPGPVVPLSNEAGPFRNRQLGWLGASRERGLLIAASGSCKQVNAIELAGRKRYALAARSNSVRPPRRGQSKANAGIVDYVGQHFRRQRFSLR